MKFATVFGLVCLVALVANASDPTFPVTAVCSIKGTGKMTYKETLNQKNTELTGSGTMKRVNDVAKYVFNAKNDKTEAFFEYLVRPDIPCEGIYYVYLGRVNSAFIGKGVYGCVNYSKYKYDKSFKPIKDLDYNAFTYTDKTNGFKLAFLFSDKNKLVGEYLKYTGNTLTMEVTIKYDKVEFFPHYEVDSQFSSDTPNRSDFRAPSTRAISSRCVQDDGFSLSASELLLALAILAVLFVSL